MARLLLGPLCLLLLLLTGCVAPVAFTAPCAPGPNPNSNSCQATAPVTQATMSFASNFDPSNSLTVTFNNQTVTNLLTPPPAPNGTSTLLLPQPPTPNYYTSATQTLTASATCGFFCVYPTKTVTFTPLVLSIGSVVTGVGPVGPLNVQLSTPLLAFVVVSPQPSSATFSATLTASPPGMVAFATSPSGPSSPSITLPVAGEARVYLQAVGPTGSFTVMVAAAGVQAVQQPGEVIQ